MTRDEHTDSVANNPFQRRTACEACEALAVVTVYMLHP
jgi:hypothetical protein